MLFTFDSQSVLDDKWFQLFVKTTSAIQSTLHPALVSIPLEYYLPRACPPRLKEYNEPLNIILLLNWSDLLLITKHLIMLRNRIMVQVPWVQAHSRGLSKVEGTLNTWNWENDRNSSWYNILDSELLSLGWLSIFLPLNGVSTLFYSFIPRNNNVNIINK